MKKRKKVKTSYAAWSYGKRRAKKNLPMWSDADHNCFAYGYEDGYAAAVRELTPKKARRK